MRKSPGNSDFSGVWKRRIDALLNFRAANQEQIVSLVDAAGGNNLRIRVLGHPKDFNCFNLKAQNSDDNQSRSCQNQDQNNLPDSVLPSALFRLLLTPFQTKFFPGAGDLGLLWWTLGRADFASRTALA